MRVLHLYDEHQPVKPGTGSVSSMIYHIATRTSQKGHEVAVVERQWDGFQPKKELGGIYFKRLNMRVGSDKPGVDIPSKLFQSLSGKLQLLIQKTEFATRAIPFIHEYNPDVIHVHLPFSANIIAHLYPNIRKKMIYTAHIGEENRRLGLNKDDYVDLISLLSPDLRLMKKVNKVTVLNPDLKKQLCDKKNICNISVMSNGVDLEEFSPNRVDVSSTIDKYGIDDTDSIIFYCGSITKRKSVLKLVQAFDDVKSKSGSQLVIAGDCTIDTEYVDSIKTYISKNNLQNKVSVLGYIPYDDLKNLYSIADLFVLPSLEEGFGMVLTEALASGTAVIGTNVGGIPLQINDGVNGYLIEPNNIEQLSDKLSKLLENSDIREEMGAESRKIAETNYDWKFITEKYIKLYNDMRNEI